MNAPHGGTSDATPATGLVEMAMAYFRSRVLCAAARLRNRGRAGKQQSAVLRSLRAPAGLIAVRFTVSCLLWPVSV